MKAIFYICLMVAVLVSCAPKSYHQVAPPTVPLTLEFVMGDCVPMGDRIVDCPFKIKWQGGVAGEGHFLITLPERKCEGDGSN